MRLLTVNGRIDVLAAGEQQSVQAVENLACDVGIDWLGRQQHCHPASRGDALKVDGWKETGGHIPYPGLRLIQVGGQADHRRLSTHRGRHLVGFSRSAWSPGQNRSNPRTRSQSVTAALN